MDWFLYDSDLCRERVTKGLETLKFLKSMPIAEFKGTVMKIRKNMEVFLIKIMDKIMSFLSSNMEIWEIFKYFFFAFFFRFAYIKKAI